jgi:hypothetical protein
MFGLLWWQSNLVARIAMDFFSRTCVTAQDSFTGSNEEKTEGVAGLVGYRVGRAIELARGPVSQILMCMWPKVA